MDSTITSGYMVVNVCKTQSKNHTLQTNETGIYALNNYCTTVNEVKEKKRCEITSCHVSMVVANSGD